MSDEFLGGDLHNAVSDTIDELEEDNARLRSENAELRVALTNLHAEIARVYITTKIVDEQLVLACRAAVNAIAGYEAFSGGPLATHKPASDEIGE